jgi:aryl carrier-like protein
MVEANFLRWGLDSEKAVELSLRYKSETCDCAPEETVTSRAIIEVLY